MEHHLRLFGANARVFARPSHDDVESARRLASDGVVVVALMPDVAFCRVLGVSRTAGSQTPPSSLQAATGPPLRTLTPHVHFSGPGTAVVLDGGEAVWLSLGVGSGAIVLVGTDLELDLRRFRQGDPARASSPPEEVSWGIPGERPNYLFEHQLDPARPRDRPADHLVAALVRAVTVASGSKLPPLLPGGAPGAVVVTGDDDQAFLERYELQLALLDGLPVTYFLHPLTRHDRPSLEALRARGGVEFGLHPDALDAPQRYSELLAEQSAWFEKLTGERARSVRNHGFLNDGYWGHLDAWVNEGFAVSANIPGVDGRAVNGSLLPARVERDGVLTPHWSILTAIGDGIQFALGLDDRASADRILSLGEEIVAESLPGVIVLNLHPQNVDKTESMHLAARALVDEGFLAWTLGECIDWFQARDRGPASW